MDNENIHWVKKMSMGDRARLNVKIAIDLADSFGGSVSPIHGSGNEILE